VDESTVARWEREKRRARKELLERVEVLLASFP
jgi:hypothetical protein